MARLRGQSVGHISRNGSSLRFGGGDDAGVCLCAVEERFVVDSVVDCSIAAGAPAVVGSGVVQSVYVAGSEAQSVSGKLRATGGVLLCCLCCNIVGGEC